MLDLVAERRAPFSPDSVVTEFAAALKAYRVATVSGDRYAGEWPREAFSKHGITYAPAEQNKSDIYLAFLPLLNSGPRRTCSTIRGRLRSWRAWSDVRRAADATASIMRPALTTTSLTQSLAHSSCVSAATGPMRIAPEVMRRIHRNREIRKRCLTSGVDYQATPQARSTCLFSMKE